MTPCYPFKEQLSFYMDGVLKSKERSRLMVHLGKCTHCTRDLGSLRKIADTLQSLKEIEPPRDLLINVRNRISAESSWKQFLVGWQILFQRSLPALGMSLLLVVGGTAVTWYYTQASRHVPIKKIDVPKTEQEKPRQPEPAKPISKQDVKSKYFTVQEWLIHELRIQSIKDDPGAPKLNLSQLTTTGATLSVLGVPLPLSLKLIADLAKKIPLNLEDQVQQLLNTASHSTQKIIKKVQGFTQEANEIVKETVTTTLQETPEQKTQLSEKIEQNKQEAKEATHKPKEQLKNVMNETQQGIEKTLGAVQETVKETVEKTNDELQKLDTTIEPAKDKVKETIHEIRETTKETIRDVRDTAKETAREARETAKETAREVREAVKETSREVRETTRETSRETRETAREITRDTRNTVRDTVKDVKDTVQDVVDDVEDTVGDILDGLL
jgi:gas vesicle protein